MSGTNRVNLMERIRLLHGRIKISSRWFLFAFFPFVLLFALLIADEIKIKNTVAFTVATVLDQSFDKPHKAVKYFREDGRKLSTTASNFSAVVSVPALKKHLLFVGVVAVILAIFAAYPAAVLMTMLDDLSGNKDGSKYVRGGKFLDSKKFKKLLQSEGAASDLTVGGIPIKKNSETQHIFISGDTGSGKGNAIKEMLDAVCARGERFIIYDKSGEYVSKYFRENRDIILNPFDARMPLWTVWNEIQAPYDYDHLAASFIPRYTGSSDQHWIDAPRTLFAEVLRLLAEKNKRSHADLLRVFQDKELITKLLENSIAKIEIDEASPEHANSVKAVLVPFIKSLRYVPDSREEYFSIREWVRNESDDRRVFIYVDNQMKESVRSLVSVWLDIAVSEALSLSDSFTRRLWVVIDELASIGRLESLSDGVIEGRKKGLCCLLSVASILLFKDLYGNNMGSTMASFCGTKLSFRSDNPEITRWLADLYGEEDVKDQKESVTIGKDNRNAKSVSDQRTVRHLVMPTEFQALKDKEGLLKVVGGYPITKVFVDHKDRPTLATVFQYQDPDTKAMEIKFKNTQAQDRAEAPKQQKRHII